MNECQAFPFVWRHKENTLPSCTYIASQTRTHAHTGIYNMSQRDPTLLDESIRGEHSFLSSSPLALNSRGRRVIDAYLTCLVYIFIRRWRRWIWPGVPFVLTWFSLSLSPPLRLSLPTPRVHTQASPAGGEADRQQGSYSQTFASHCMSASCTSRQQHNECHMSNDAALPLTYGNSVIYGNVIVVFWLMPFWNRHFFFFWLQKDVCSYVLFFLRSTTFFQPNTNGDKNYQNEMPNKEIFVSLMEVRVATNVVL